MLAKSFRALRTWRFGMKETELSYPILNKICFRPAGEIKLIEKNLNKKIS